MNFELQRTWTASASSSIKEITSVVKQRTNLFSISCSPCILIHCNNLSLSILEQVVPTNSHSSCYNKIPVKRSNRQTDLDKMNV